MAEVDFDIDENEDQDPRASREHETREVSNRPKMWAPPTVLPVPDPQDGYVFRWIRVGMRGSPDNTNVSRKYREGWEPVRLEDYPELMMIPDIDNRFEGSAVIGGLMLCKNSAEAMRQKREYLNDQSQTQIDAVDESYLREQDARMPMFKPERRTRVTFGDGS